MIRAALAFGLLALAVSARAEKLEKAFPSEGLDKLEVSAAAGSVVVEGGALPRVTVIVSDADPERCKITMERDGSTLKLKAEDKSKLQLKSCKAGFFARSPRALAVDAATGSGNIRVLAVAAPLSLDAGSGDVRVTDVEGDLTARIGSGSLKGGGKLASVSAKVGSGRVELAWARAPKAGGADIVSGSGDVTLVFPKDARLKTELVTGSGHTRDESGEPDDAGYVVSVKTGSGSVAVLTK